MNALNHIPLPKYTPAFNGANCGAVSLNPENIYKVQGGGTKADWCGSKGSMPPKYCKKRTNIVRHQCRNCGQTAINAKLLGEPAKLEIPQG